MDANVQHFSNIQIKKIKKIALIFCRGENLSVFISSITIYCKKFLYLHIKNRELIEITLKYTDHV